MEQHLALANRLAATEADGGGAPQGEGLVAALGGSRRAQHAAVDGAAREVVERLADGLDRVLAEDAGLGRAGVELARQVAGDRHQAEAAVHHHLHLVAKDRDAIHLALEAHDDPAFSRVVYLAHHGLGYVAGVQPVVAGEPRQMTARRLDRAGTAGRSRRGGRRRQAAGPEEARHAGALIERELADPPGRSIRMQPRPDFRMHGGTTEAGVELGAGCQSELGGAGKEQKRRTKRDLKSHGETPQSGFST